MKKIIKNKYFLILLVLILILLGSITFVVGKYISDKKYSSSNIYPSNFNFTSDYATVDGKNYNTSDWGTGTKIKVYNYDLYNNSKITDDDILYTITVPADWNVIVYDELGVEVLKVDGKYKLSSNSSTFHEIVVKYVGVEILPSTFDLVIKSVVPYTKELKAKFTPNTPATPEYLITDMGNYWKVVIKTNSYSGNLIIKWNVSQVSPDNTNPLMSSWYDSNPEQLINVISNSTYELVFVENLNDDYTFTNKFSTTIEISKGVGA